MGKVAAVNFGASHHLFDHIAPLAYLLDIPFFVDDHPELLEKFYPQISFTYKETLSFDFLAKNFDTLISCNRWMAEDKFSFMNLFDKNMKLLFCPHGNSDKGHIVFDNMLDYAIHDAVMLYGSQMIDFLKKLDVFDRLKQHVVIGNFRLGFYKKFKDFYNRLVAREIFSKLDSRNRTILYAPTWKDPENSTSFFEVFQKVVKKVPQHYNLIVKLHPLIEERNPVEYYQIYEKKLPANVLFLEQFPLVFPLLDAVDVYLGDFSSVGYDFLYFQKPMFFLDPLQRDPLKDQSAFLHQCGIRIPKEYWDNIFSFIDDHISKSYRERQKRMFYYAFGKEQTFLQIKEKIFEIL